MQIEIYKMCMQMVYIHDPGHLSLPPRRTFATPTPKWKKKKY